MDKECARDRGKGGEQEKKQWRDGETDGREDVEEMQRGSGGGRGGGMEREEDELAGMEGMGETGREKGEGGGRRRK